MAGINGREYQHSTLSLNLVGLASTFTFETFRGVQYKVAAPKEAVKSKGRNVGHVVKEEDTSGPTMTVLQSEWKSFRAWFASNYPGKKLGLISFDAELNYGDDPTDLMTDGWEGMMFQEDARNVTPDQNALEVALPLFIKHIHPHGGDFI